VLPPTHGGKSDRVVQATQDWVDKSVAVSNDADHYKQAQQRQQSIQVALEDSTQKTLALPDVGRKTLPLPYGIPEHQHASLYLVQDATKEVRAGNVPVQYDEAFANRVLDVKQDAPKNPVGKSSAQPLNRVQGDFSQEIQTVKNVADSLGITVQDLDKTHPAFGTASYKNGTISLRQTEGYSSFQHLNTVTHELSHFYMAAHVPNISLIENEVATESVASIVLGTLSPENANAVIKRNKQFIADLSRVDEYKRRFTETDYKNYDELQQTVNKLEPVIRNASNDILSRMGVKPADAKLELINKINSGTMAVGTNDQGVIDSLQNGIATELPRGQTTPSVRLESNFEVARNDAMANTGRNHPDPTRLNNNGTVVEVKPDVSQPVEGNAPLTEDIRERLLNSVEQTLDIGDPLERKALKRIKSVLHGDNSSYNDVVNAFSAYTAQAGLTSESYASNFQRYLKGELTHGGYDSIAHANPDGTMSLELLDPSKQLPIHSQEMPQVSPIEQAGARYNTDSTRASNNPYDVHAQVDHQESATQLLARISQDSATNTASAERDLLQSTHEALDAYDKLGLEASHERAQKQVNVQQDAQDHFDALDRHLNTTSKNPCDI